MMVRLAVLILAATPMALSQALPPAILQNGVFNSASRFAMALPGGALAPGARFTIQGVRLAEGAQKPEVRIQSGTSTTTARVLSSTADRIEGIIPPRLAPGPATLTVVRGSEVSRPYPLRIAASAPGLYTVDGSGAGFGRFDRVVSGGRTPVTANTPAKPGDRVSLAATGFGVGETPKVIVGQIAASGVRVVRQAGKPDAVEFDVPASVPASCFVPAYLVTREGAVSNAVSLPVDPKRSPCRPAADWFVPGAGRQAVILLARMSMLLEFQPGDPQPGAEERVSASFFDAGQPAAVLPLHLIPPAGTCTGLAGQYEPGGLFDSILQFGGKRSLRGLDAGPAIQVGQGESTRPVRASGAGLYSGSLVPRRERMGRDSKPFLLPGMVRIASAGGADVGPFQVALRATSALSWTNRDQTETVMKHQGITLEWSGADPTRSVLVTAVSVDQSSTAAFATLCVAAPGQTRFHIAPESLTNLPATVPAAGPPHSLLFVLQSPSGGSAPIAAPGLDGGQAIFLAGSGRSVQFR